jgi:predicted RNA methylase
MAQRNRLAITTWQWRVVFDDAIAMLKLTNFIRRAWTSVNDYILHISTLEAAQWDEHVSWAAPPTRDNSHYKDANAYASPDYYYLRKLTRLLELTPSDVVYDLGCGKGRIVCLISRTPVRRCVGIEISEALAAVASSNAQTVLGRRAPVDIRCEDAAESCLADGTVFILYNPFGRKTLESVLKRIERTLIENPRDIRVAYVNSVHHDIFSRFAWMDPWKAFTTFGGSTIQLYRGRYHSAPAESRQ